MSNAIIKIIKESSSFTVVTSGCNKWWKIFTTKPKWRKTLHSSLPNPVNSIWIFYHVSHALFPNIFLKILPFEMTVSICDQRGSAVTFLIIVEPFPPEEKGHISFVWIQIVCKINPLVPGHTYLSCRFVQVSVTF